MKKRLLLVLAALGMSVLMAACGSKNTNADTKPEETTTKAAETEAAETKEETTEATIEETTQATTEETEPETEIQTEAETEKQEDADNASGDWTDLRFTLEGKDLTMKFPYSELKDMGWTLDLAEYGYPDGYIMNPGDKTYGTIDLENDKYKTSEIPTGVELSVGFINTDDKAKDILECGIWSMRFYVTYAIKRNEDYPEISFCGVKFGDSAEKVVNTFGETDDTYRSDDLGYTQYGYSGDSGQKFRVTVYDEYGITEMEIQDYGR